MKISRLVEGWNKAIATRFTKDFVIVRGLQAKRKRPTGEAPKEMLMLEA